VEKALAAMALEGFTESNIISCMHVIPKISTISKAADRRNEGWIVNSHIDLATQNEVYN